jgi:hypothetical protein
MAEPLQHEDIRWNPELMEWFCAKCGLTSDHTAREDALVEFAESECSLRGTQVRKIGEQEREFRARQLSQRGS